MIMSGKTSKKKFLKKIFLILKKSKIKSKTIFFIADILHKGNTPSDGYKQYNYFVSTLHENHVYREWL